MKITELVDDGGAALNVAASLILKSIKTEPDLKIPLFEEAIQTHGTRELIKGLSTLVFLAKPSRGLPFYELVKVYKKTVNSTINQGYDGEYLYAVYSLLESMDDTKKKYEEILDSLSNSSESSDSLERLVALTTLHNLYMLHCGHRPYSIIHTIHKTKLYVKNFLISAAKNEAVVKEELDKYSRRMQTDGSVRIALTLLELTIPFDKSKNQDKQLSTLDSDALFSSDEVMEFVRVHEYDELIQGLSVVMSALVAKHISVQPLAHEFKRMQTGLVPKAYLLGGISTGDGIASAFDLLITLTKRGMFFPDNDAKFKKKLTQIQDKPDTIFALVGLFYLLNSLMDETPKEVMAFCNELTKA